MSGGLKTTLFSAFLRPWSFLRAKSDFHPRKPPLSSEQTPAFIGAPFKDIIRICNFVNIYYQHTTLPNCNFY